MAGRIIPACAGNSRQATCERDHRPGHPCVCGEHACIWKGCARSVGSSLRVRGTGDRSGVDAGCLRVIPACARNSGWMQEPRYATTGHPCVCGEQTYPMAVRGHMPGSSLRVRGTGDRSGVDAGCLRVIPACARNSGWMQEPRYATTGHPCVCGEQGRCDPRVAGRTGSSLRVRGTDIPDGGSRPYARVIPACAGNSDADQNFEELRPGHPCVCGEQQMLVVDQTEVLGSSLRVRGTDCLNWHAIEFSCQIQPL